MNQRDFLARIADEMGKSLSEVKRFYETFKDVTKHVVVKEGDEVRLTKFLKVGSKVKKERTGFNPSSQEKIIIPSKKVTYAKILGDWKTIETY